MPRRYAPICVSADHRRDLAAAKPRKCRRYFECAWKRENFAISASWLAEQPGFEPEQATASSSKNALHPKADIFDSEQKRFYGPQPDISPKLSCCLPGKASLTYCAPVAVAGQCLRRETEGLRVPLRNRLSGRTSFAANHSHMLRTVAVSFHVQS